MTQDVEITILLQTWFWQPTTPAYGVNISKLICYCCVHVSCTLTSSVEKGFWLINLEGTCSEFVLVVITILLTDVKFLSYRWKKIRRTDRKLTWPLLFVLICNAQPPGAPEIIFSWIITAGVLLFVCCLVFLFLFCYM